MKVNVSPAAYQEKSIIRNLMQFYLYEFSSMGDLEIDATGQFNYRFLDHYWLEPGRHPYLIRVAGRLGGFVLLKRGTYFPHQLESEQQGMQVAEFFVLKTFRRQGVGTKAALDLFPQFPGRWEIAQEPGNHAGQAFWRSLLKAYCGGDFKELFLDNESWHGPVQVFDNSSFAD